MTKAMFMRRWLAWSALLFMCFSVAGVLAAGPGEATAGEDEPAGDEAEAALIGLRRADESLETLWIDADGIQWLGEQIAIERADGWWRVGVSSRGYPDPDGRYQERWIWTLPAGRSPSLPPRHEYRSQHCSHGESLEVHHVGLDWISASRHYYSFCDMANHASSNGSLGLLPYTGELHDGRDVGEPRLSPAITSILGAEIGTAFQTAVEKRFIGSGYRPGPPGRPWALYHEQGRWRVLTGKYLSSGFMETHLRTFGIDLPIPASLTGDESPPVPWDGPAERRIGLEDMVVSPGGRLALKRFSRELKLEVDGEPRGSRPARNSAIVMVRWVKGAEAARVRAEAARVLQEAAARDAAALGTFDASLPTAGAPLYRLDVWPTLFMPRCLEMPRGIKVLRTPAELDDFVRVHPGSCYRVTWPPIDFDRQSLVGVSGKAGCRARIEPFAYRDDAQMRYRVLLRIHEGDCSRPERWRRWLVVPKVPVGYRVVVDQEWFDRSRKESGTKSPAPGE